MAERRAVRSVSAGPEQAWLWLGQAQHPCQGGTHWAGKHSNSWNLGPRLAPGGPGSRADPEGRTGGGWHRAGQRITLGSGGEDLRAEVGTQNGSQAFTPRTF